MRTVLIVGPHQDVAPRLRQSGFHVLSAVHACEAFHLLKQFVVSIILCDVQLPDMTSSAFRRRLLECPTWGKIPFVALATRPETEEERSLFPRIVPQPLEPEAVLKEVARYS